MYEVMGDDMIACFHMGRDPGKHFAEPDKSTPDGAKSTAVCVLSR